MFSVSWVSWTEAGEKGKESFNDATVVLGMMALRISKHPRRPDLHRFPSVLSLLSFETKGNYAISLCLTVY